MDPPIKVLGNALVARGELDHDDEERFKECLRSLLAADHADFVIDLSAVRYLSSSYVRHVVLAITWAMQNSRKVTVRANNRVLRLLTLSGIDQVVTIEVTEEPPSVEP